MPHSGCNYYDGYGDLVERKKDTVCAMIRNQSRWAAFSLGM